jgi:hypothetical protein
LREKHSYKSAVLQCRRTTKMGFTDVVRSRDLIVWLLVAITLYMSLLESPYLDYSIEPAWFIDKRGENAIASSSIFERGRNKKAATTDDAEDIRHMTLITDLDGNGMNELLTITNDYHMKLFSAELHGQVGHEIYHPKEVLSIPLTEKGIKFRRVSEVAVYF